LSIPPDHWELKEISKREGKGRLEAGMKSKNPREGKVTLRKGDRKPVREKSELNVKCLGGGGQFRSD